MTKARVLLLIALVVAFAHAPANAGGADVTIPLTCFPADGAPTDPPCLVPVGLPSDTLDGTSGSLRLRVRDDGSTDLRFKVEGLDPSWVVTAWLSYFFPPGPTPDPIFDGTAAVSVPAASTIASFSEGRNTEPNQLTIDAGGQGRLAVRLDYNPLEAHQGPLRNDLVVTEQTAAPDGSGAEQPTCCLGAVQPIGSSFLRVFDEATGFQVLDGEGRAEILRSPVPGALFVLVIHLDGTTHGINPGIPIFPVPGVPVEAGDHFLIGIFDLTDVLE